MICSQGSGLFGMGFQGKIHEIIDFPDEFMAIIIYRDGNPFTLLEISREDRERLINELNIKK